MGSEGDTCGVGEFYLAAATERLGCSEFAVRQRAVYPQRTSLQVHITPTERQHFAGPQPSGDGNDVQGMQTIAFGGLQQSPGLLAVQGPDLLTPDLRRVHVLTDVAVHNTP